MINKNSEIRFKIFGIDNNQPIWAENFRRELFKSKMALNLSQGELLKFYSSDRLAQLVGNGILTFVDIKSKLNKLFSNKEVVFYKDIKDLSKKINFYKNSHNIRNRIAQNGMKKYHKYMNSTIVASYIINKTLNIKESKKYIWEKK